MKYKKGENFKDHDELLMAVINGEAYCYSDETDSNIFYEKGDDYYFNITTDIENYYKAIEIKTKEVTLYRYTFKALDKTINQTAYTSETWKDYSGRIKWELLKTETKTIEIEGE